RRTTRRIHAQHHRLDGIILTQTLEGARQCRRGDALAPSKRACRVHGDLPQSGNHSDAFFALLSSPTASEQTDDLRHGGRLLARGAISKQRFCGLGPALRLGRRQGLIFKPHMLDKTNFLSSLRRPRSVLGLLLSLLWIFCPLRNPYQPLRAKIAEGILQVAKGIFSWFAASQRLTATLVFTHREHVRLDARFVEGPLEVTQF